MKTQSLRLVLVIASLFFALSVAAPTPSTVAQNANSSTTMSQNANSSITPVGVPCRSRCYHQYRRCLLRANENSPLVRRCRVRYRRCRSRCMV